MILKVQDKGITPETGTISFQALVSLLCTFRTCKSCVHFHMYISSKSYCLYTFLYLSMTLAFIMWILCQLFLILVGTEVF